MWSVFNLVLLIAALLVGFEQPQVRTAHRLQRRLPILISSRGQTIMGKTVNISETGALISLETWPNLLEEAEVEVMGDYTASASLTAQIVRVSPINDTETLLAVDFVKLNNAQRDALTLVLYSDVREWYSQKGQYVDRPFASLGFLATSLTRALRDVKQTSLKKVRKQVNSHSRLYWDGNFFFAVATELGTTGLRLEIEDTKAVSSHKMIGQQDLHTMRTVKPLVGLLLNEDEDNLSSNRFVAEIHAVEEQTNGKIALELVFPEKLKERQDTKIKQLLEVL